MEIFLSMILTTMDRSVLDHWNLFDEYFIFFSHETILPKINDPNKLRTTTITTAFKEYHITEIE